MPYVKRRKGWLSDVERPQGSGNMEATYLRVVTWEANARDYVSETKARGNQDKLVTHGERRRTQLFR